MIRDFDVDVIENVVSVGLRIFSGDDTGVLGIAIGVNEATHGESGGAIGLPTFNWVTPGYLNMKGNNRLN